MVGQTFNSTKSITDLANECLTSRKNINNIVTLLSLGENEKEEVSYAALTALMQVFVALRADEAMVVKTISDWLDSNFKLFVDILLKHLTYGSNHMQLHSLNMLLEAVKLQAKLLSMAEKEFTFPNMLFSRICEACWSLEARSSSSPTNVQHLTAAWVSLLDEYADLKYFFYRNIGKLAKSETKENPSFALQILMKCDPPASTAEEWDPVFFCACDQLQEMISSSNISQFQSHRKYFSECWFAVLRCSMTFEMYRKILAVMHKRILPHLDQPTMLIDFLTDSYNSGGVVSILALNGLFTLIVQHNLDYPDFYKRLYSLLTVNITRVKYRSRFFRLLALFLSSTHLPSQMVASFIKRLSSLTLSAPPAASLVILPLIYNLFRAHPSCIRMIHASKDIDPGFVDPYISIEEDPEKTNAIDSYLWELKSMQNHYVPGIAQFARIFEEPLSQPAYDLEDFLDMNYDQLMTSDFGSEASLRTDGGLFDLYDF